MEMSNMCRLYVISVILSTTIAQEATDRVPLEGPAEDYMDRGQDGSYKFGYKNLDYGSHYHTAAATRDNTVAGSYGSRDPASRRVVQTTYTAGSRGFRARGPNIARQMDLSQAKTPFRPPVPPDSPDYQPSYDGYHDPNEDPSYRFTVKTPTYTRGESADSKGAVNGAYSYVDDVGKRHDVKYEAGSATGFRVKNAFPDSEPYGGLFYRGPNKAGTPPRGHLSIVQGNDGAYQFTATGPDQKRVEVSDSVGRVRGSYTYIDDKGVQRSVQYVAGPNIGYKVVRKGSGPVYSSVYPFPATDYLLPPLPPLPDSTTTSDDLFTPTSDNGDFLGTTEKPSTTERSRYWNTPYTTLKPSKPGDVSDFFDELNPSKHDNDHTESSQSSTPSFNDIFGDKPNDYDGGSSGNEFKQRAGYDSSRGRPSNAYSYPRPNKHFNEETNRHSDASGSFLGLPPGVVVRAHVQSLDILPYGSKIPPPEETLRKHLLEELHRDR